MNFEASFLHTTESVIAERCVDSIFVVCASLVLEEIGSEIHPREWVVVVVVVVVVLTLTHRCHAVRGHRTGSGCYLECYTRRPGSNRPMPLVLFQWMVCYILV